MIGESFLSPEIYEIAEQISDSCHELEVYETCLDNLGRMDFQSLSQYVNNFYYGEYSSDEDFVKCLYEDDTFNIPNWIVIDWEATAKSIMYDYFESNGYYFRA